MKTTSPKLFRRTVGALAVTIICGFAASSAQAGYIVTLKEVGSNVVATGNGPIDLTGLTLITSAGSSPGIQANLGVIATGAFATGGDVYQGFTGPTSFGSGGAFSPDTASGDFVEVSGVGLQLLVPVNYVSGAALSDSMTFNNATFASLGVTPGTYVWTWGAGADQNFTIVIPRAGVPDAGSTLGLFFGSLIALFGVGRFCTQRLALLTG